MDKSEIENLVSLKQEGPYWDFKREWYAPEKIADLLHDIICMANNLCNRDAYIIIGVDEEKDYTTYSVKSDPNRRCTQQLVDFLRDKHFVGGMRPIISVESICLDEDLIDVIVVYNSNLTPYFLIKNYRDIRANYINTRVMDSNTPKDRSADLPDIEMLWKKRFGLLSSTLERMKIYLQDPDSWVCSSDDCDIEIKYYRFSPEFTIESVIDENKKGYQYYLFNQIDIHPRWYDINLYFHQTKLASIEGVYLDGGRYFTTTPNTDGVSLTRCNQWDISFKYFIKDSIEYIVHKFYYLPDGDDATYAHNRFIECVLVFDSHREKERFKEYIKQLWPNKANYNENIGLPSFPRIEGYNMEAFKEEYINSQILKRMFEEFREKQLRAVTR